MGVVDEIAGVEPENPITGNIPGPGWPPPLRSLCVAKATIDLLFLSKIKYRYEHLVEANLQRFAYRAGTVIVRPSGKVIVCPPPPAGHGPSQVWSITIWRGPRPLLLSTTMWMWVRKSPVTTPEVAVTPPRRSGHTESNAQPPGTG